MADKRVCGADRDIHKTHRRWCFGRRENTNSVKSHQELCFWKVCPGKSRSFRHFEIRRGGKFLRIILGGNKVALLARKRHNVTDSSRGAFISIIRSSCVRGNITPGKIWTEISPMCRADLLNFCGCVFTIKFCGEFLLRLLRSLCARVWMRKELEALVGNCDRTWIQTGRVQSENKKHQQQQQQPCLPNFLLNFTLAWRWEACLDSMRSLIYQTTLWVFVSLRANVMKLRLQTD